MSTHGTGFIRMAQGTATAVLGCTVALLLPVMSGGAPDAVPAWHATARVLPQALALALPIGFLLSTVFYAAGARMSVRLAMATLLVSAFVAFAATANFALLVPWANVTTRDRPSVLREPNELFPRELRAERRAAARAGDGDRVRALDVYFHSRWAFASASLVFAVVALALTANRARTLLYLTLSMVTMLALYYGAWRVALWAALSGRVASWAAAWGPNAVVLLVAGVLAARRRRGPRTRGRTRVEPLVARGAGGRRAAAGRRHRGRRGLPLTMRDERRR